MRSCGREDVRRGRGGSCVSRSRVRGAGDWARVRDRRGGAAVGLTGWCCSGCAGRARRSARAARIYEVRAVRVSRTWRAGDTPFELVGEVAGAGVGVEAADEQDARHRVLAVVVVVGSKPVATQSPSKSARVPCLAAVASPSCSDHRPWTTCAYVPGIVISSSNPRTDQDMLHMQRRGAL